MFVCTLLEELDFQLTEICELAKLNMLERQLKAASKHKSNKNLNLTED